LSKIVWHRFRKLWLSLFFKSVSNSARAESFRIGVLTQPMKVNLQNNANYSYSSTYKSLNDICYAGTNPQ
jgi:hypothetical protein